MQATTWVKSVWCAAIVGAALALGPVGLHAQKQFQVFASVVDAKGVPVTSIVPADIRLTENDADATVTKVEPLNWPIKLQILVDNGIGLGGANINQLRTGIAGLLEALPPNLEVTIVSTAPQPRFLVRATTDRAAMVKGLDVLSPDTGVGRFIESLAEATQRIERDKTDSFPVIVSVGTNLGDRNARESDINAVMERVQKRPTIVHVVMFSGSGQSGSGGGNQVDFGLNVTKATRGRYEGINSATRLATLLPEIGAQIAKAIERQSRQFRITADRPASASGNIGRIGASAKAPFTLAGISFDGRVAVP
jgi:hypothetical protein